MYVVVSCIVTCTTFLLIVGIGTTLMWTRKNRVVDLAEHQPLYCRGTHSMTVLVDRFFMCSFICLFSAWELTLVIVGTILSALLLATIIGAVVVVSLRYVSTLRSSHLLRPWVHRTLLLTTTPRLLK